MSGASPTHRRGARGRKRQKSDESVQLDDPAPAATDQRSTNRRSNADMKKAFAYDLSAGNYDRAKRVLGVMQQNEADGGLKEDDSDPTLTREAILEYAQTAIAKMSRTLGTNPPMADFPVPLPIHITQDDSTKADADLMPDSLDATMKNGDPQKNPPLAPWNSWRNRLWNSQFSFSQVAGATQAKQIMQTSLIDPFRATNLFPESLVTRGIMLYGVAGTGKCLRIGTPVIMYDGTVRNIETIKENELVMGDDSTPRRVTGLMNGFGRIYRVTPNKGEPYFVNANHILSLRSGVNAHVARDREDKKGGRCRVTWMDGLHKKSKTFTYAKYGGVETAFTAANAFLVNDLPKLVASVDNNVVDISVQEFLALSAYMRKHLKGFRVALDFENGEEIENLPLDPWILGYWLGDGTSATSEITTADNEIVCEFEKWAASSKECQTIRKTTDKYGYRINGESNRQPKRNHMLVTLQRLHLINNKHIPHAYKTASRQARLALLAGLMDSDGSLDGRSGCFDFVQKSETLFDDVMFVARSLGFSCYKQICTKTCTNSATKATGTYFRCAISGEISDIPTRVHRKQYKRKRTQSKSVLVTGIDLSVEEENGHYFGFELDGNGRFVLGDFTVTHNTTIATAAVNALSFTSDGSRLSPEGFRSQEEVQQLVNNSKLRGWAVQHWGKEPPIKLRGAKGAAAKRGKEAPYEPTPIELASGIFTRSDTDPKARAYDVVDPEDTSKTFAMMPVPKVIFFQVTVADVKSVWIGESTRRLERWFELANEVAPAIIFFDEAETYLNEDDESNADTITTFKQQFGGLMVKRGVTLIVATNYPMKIEPAIRSRLAAGAVEVGLPDFEARKFMIGAEIDKVFGTSLLKKDQYVVYRARVVDYIAKRTSPPFVSLCSKVTSDYKSNSLWSGRDIKSLVISAMGFVRSEMIKNNVRVRTCTSRNNGDEGCSAYDTEKLRADESIYVQSESGSQTVGAIMDAGHGASLQPSPITQKDFSDALDRFSGSVDADSVRDQVLFNGERGFNPETPKEGENAQKWTNWYVMKEGKPSSFECVLSRTHKEEYPQIGANTTVPFD